VTKKTIYLFLLFLSTFFFSSPLFCDDVTKTECVEKVETVSQIIIEQGIRKAAEEVMKKRSEFVWKDSYVFIIHVNGLCLAHPGKPKLIGKNVIDLKDADGKYFIKDFIESATEKGACWTDYKWSRPNSKKSIFKITYVQKTDDFIVGAGMYIE